jgi:hypothetical protein
MMSSLVVICVFVIRLYIVYPITKAQALSLATSTCGEGGGGVWRLVLKNSLGSVDVCWRAKTFIRDSPPMDIQIEHVKYSNIRMGIRSAPIKAIKK